MFVFVYMILILFSQGFTPCETPAYGTFFITGLLICHSFLDMVFRPSPVTHTAYGIVFCLKTEMRTRRRLTHLSAVGGG
jgi:hypothetical protein